MPYCVRCGVELPPDAVKCPLCATPVVLPPVGGDVQNHGGGGWNELFPSEAPVSKTHGLDKRRKGALELLFGITLITEVVLAVSLLPSSVGWFIPMLSVLFGALCVVVPLVLPVSYRWFSTGWLALSALFLGTLGISSNGCYWSAVACASIVLGWLCFVFPFFLPRKRRWASVIVQLAAVLSFLYMLDFLGDGRLSWFLPVAVPVVGVFFVSAGILVLRMRLSRHVDFPLADLLLSVCCIACVTVGAGDVSATRYLTGRWGVGWSGTLWVSAGVLIVFLLLVGCSRRIRRYFTSQVSHS